MAGECAGVLPLGLVSGRRRQIHPDDLVGGALGRVAVLERDVLEETQVKAQLRLARERRLQILVAERNLFRRTAGDRKHLVLRGEWRPEAGRAVRRTEFQLVDARQTEELSTRQCIGYQA